MLRRFVLGACKPSSPAESRCRNFVSTPSKPQRAPQRAEPQATILSEMRRKNRLWLGGKAVRKLPFYIAVVPAKAKYFSPNFARSVAVVSEFRQEFGCEIELFEQPS